MAYKTAARNKNPKNQKKRPVVKKTQMKAKKKGVQNGTQAMKRIVDARQKIIQKKRNTVVDARDILAKMAKTQDARSKLRKLRENKGSTVNEVKVIGNSILKKTDRNGKISLVTSKNKQSTKDINVAIQQQLGLIPPARNPKKTAVRRLQSPNRKPTHVNPTVVRKTVVNDFDYPPFPEVYCVDNRHLYQWVKPDLRPSSSVLSRRPIHITARNDLALRSDDWRDYTRTTRTRSAFDDMDVMEIEDIPPMQTITLQRPTRSSNVHSRLDSMPAQPTTHGILSQTKTKVVVPAGHRIIVSNLQSSVTQDDIKELFEDIGHLLVARLVRPGTAEVIYQNLKDAQKAVDTYHNRQLDGQPMKCLLVNKRPYNNPTGPALTASEGILSRKPNVSNTKLVPDISTIHKVLFQRK